MGEGSSGGGGGGGRDEQKRFDPSRPVTRPDPAEVARALEAKRQMAREPGAGVVVPGPLPGRASMTPEQRALEQARAEEFAALETRADDDRFLRNNPLRRLGYRVAGGLKGIDYMPLGPDVAAMYGRGYGEPEYRQELFGDLTRPGLPVFDSVQLMDPEKAEAFDRGTLEYLLEPGTVAIGPNYYSGPVRAHEFGHYGVDVIEDQMRDNPSLMDPFWDAGISPIIDWGVEEGVIELSDDPRESWNLPSGGIATMAPTIQFLGSPEASWRDRLGIYENVLQDTAQGILTEMGEPPSAVMRQPGPGNLYYGGLWTLPDGPGPF